ncbi:hypothetical protein [Fulvivirga ligni]|uniref:hypothetical protein n=1 Tax=Fulvivirga ligni TaxID=2904246 RepID=UPI001F378425|nr:hypothetical protein [Fulvivirga ligni]UII22323.1 hypothetical protein LVD16_03650 [Fulvivirga ligni]
MFIEILKYGFLVIFFATAIIGIAAIPGWIKIPDYYRKRIFIALILEVVGVIIILFKQEMVVSKTLSEPKITVSPTNWTAFDENGILIQPELTVKTGDTVMTQKLGNTSYSAFKNLHGQRTKNGLIIKNSEDEILGQISLGETGLFNSFKTAKNEITSTENYAYIKWTKERKGEWLQSGSFLGPFQFLVSDYYKGTFYMIKNGDQVIFDSRESSKNLFSADNRIIHFFEQDHVFYLFRIAWADLKEKDKYIHVINVRMEPTLREVN